MISLYLLYFYTNVMHLNAGAVSIKFLVTKFIDGVSDLIVGYLIDKTNTRWGKSRPWILFGAIPFGVTAVLAFSVPDIGQTGMLIYAYVTYILLSTSYTIVNIPMASILPALSENPHERTVLASCRTFFSSVGSTVVSAFALTLVDKPGQQAVIETDGIRVREVDTDLYTAWKDGYFIYREKTLEKWE